MTINQAKTAQTCMKRVKNMFTYPHIQLISIFKAEIITRQSYIVNYRPYGQFRQSGYSIYSTKLE